ncbi:hypothetical protein [Neotabrizicola sp. VNH66]|uniref:hypothetical protein n=1 Tax=Neotabrizicola sp. VNH66 TaxID=3400918 RepID=UPI003BFE1CE3
MSSSKSLWTRLVAIAEQRSDFKALSRLSQQSDAELAARGVTRLGEMQRILGARAYY